jgi:hypothetical protein
MYLWYCNDLFYSDSCNSSHDCFGCVGLHHKEYCILNKQYSKEEYEKTKAKIIDHMKKSGEWGQFFPPSCIPYAYNETVAQDYFPLTKEQILKQGWRWKEGEESNVSGVTRKIPAEKLPDNIRDIPDDILNWAMQCSESGKLFKIQPAELAFYRRSSLPVPRLHPDIRHEKRMALRNPRKLWKRNCDKCKKEIQTTYSPERPERVYCEACYLREVY